IRVTAERADVPGEPRIGLDRQRIRGERLFAGFDRRRVAVAVTLGLQVALELRDEQATVRKDQDAEGSCRLDEARRGDRLAGGRRVAEAVATDRAGVLLGRERSFEWLVERLIVGGVLVVLFVGLLLELLHRAVPVPVPVLLFALRRRDQLGEHSGQGVDLVPAERCAGRRARLGIRQ